RTDAEPLEQARGWPQALFTGAGAHPRRELTPSRLSMRAAGRRRWHSSLWRRWSIATRRTGEHTSSIRKLDEPRVTGLRAILRQHALDGDLVVRLQGVLAPAVPRQRVWRTTFALPRLEVAVVILHVQVNPDV